MAERRMFAKTIVLSDSFLDMPLGSRALYMTLCMLSDDEGVVNNPKSIMRQCGATEDDLKVLIIKKFVIPFEKEGLVVIKHWYIHNYIQNDRFKPSKYHDLISTLELDENKAYTQSCIQDVYKVDTQVRLGKDRLGKNNTMSKPTLEEVTEYCKERNSSVNPKTFYEYFETGNWVDSKGNKVKNWKQKLITWERNNNSKQVKVDDIPNYTPTNNPIISNEELNEIIRNRDKQGNN